MADVKLRIPLVHLNGTSKQALLDQIADAGCAVQAAMRKLDDACPNQRDYYPLGEEAWREAVAQHTARLDKLSEVFGELQQIMDGLL